MAEYCYAVDKSDWTPHFYAAVRSDERRLGVYETRREALNAIARDRRKPAPPYKRVQPAWERRVLGVLNEN